MSVLSIKQLQAFMAVVEGGGFQAASRRLYTTQPAISRRITELEQSLGVRLFERTTRTCHVTPRGRLLIPHASSVLRDVSEIGAAVAAPHGVVGLVRIGVVETIALTKLPDLLNRVMSAHPGVTIDVEVDVTSALTQRLQSRQIDLGLMVAPVAEIGLQALPLWDMELAWFASARRPEKRGPLGLADLAEEDVLVHTRSRHGGVVQRWFRESGVRPRRMIGCSSLAAMVHAIEAGVGIGLVPRAAAEGKHRSAKLVRIPTDLVLPRNAFVMAHHANEADPATRACANAISAAVITYEAGDRR